MKICIKNKIIDLKKVLFVKIRKMNSICVGRCSRHEIEFEFCFKPILFIFKNTHKIKFRLYKFYDEKGQLTQKLQPKGYRDIMQFILKQGIDHMQLTDL